MSQKAPSDQKQLNKSTQKKDNQSTTLTQHQSRQVLNVTDSAQIVPPPPVRQHELRNAYNDQYIQQIQMQNNTYPPCQPYYHPPNNPNMYMNQGNFYPGPTFQPMMRGCPMFYPPLHNPMPQPMHQPMHQHPSQSLSPPYYGQFPPNNNIGYHPFPWLQMRMQNNQQNLQNNRGIIGALRNRRGKCHNYRDKKCKKQSSESSSKSKSKKTQQKKSLTKQMKQIRQKKQIQDRDSSQSEQEQNQSIQKDMKKMNLKSVQEQQWQKSSRKIQFQPWLQPFFTKYNVSQNIIHRTLQHLAKRYESLKELDNLLSILYELQNHNDFFGIVKNIIKKDYKIEDVKTALSKKMKIKQKKFNSALRFKQKFPNPAFIQFYQLQELLGLDMKKTLFLVDGNNILPKQKIFRRYFQSASPDQRAQGQVRLAWMFSETEAICQIFFDNKYEDDLYKNIKHSILSQAQQMAVNKIKVHYADKHISEQNTADMKLIQRLIQIVSQRQYEQCNIVIVSADKELLQLCNDAKQNIKQTSGRYIFKFCKELIKKRYYNVKGKKKIIKDIFIY